ncbi:wiskott-Aldrich syndrome protein family member 1-like [Bufo gargarizans]|uniref:wiskott-Aldrich syndrome protein family member 1-like n=1 Tax=Bufo gargarizans TaxID=30331 RepID=UPI001CF3D6CD|nr:wiskott-Aldrich syndrome protein family member 1-like [Bufo gargarizans]
MLRPPQPNLPGGLLSLNTVRHSSSSTPPPPPPPCDSSTRRPGLPCAPTSTPHTPPAPALSVQAPYHPSPAEWFEEDGPEDVLLSSQDPTTKQCEELLITLFFL